ncbi:fasciclin domain-containing protein [Spirosoma taeanense]|uniref:Fasciclin domain-containing protein n=1 Tax=Spirosoma taeanense TaxID=2735870 RepID=A0A6M5Y8C9_9BACT|nr:fasciclin domain-containing protein [Spirosoma taeanense]QJW89521.1 fasciclin domain-containing protein [Spirosoma taeanense]
MDIHSIFRTLRQLTVAACIGSATFLIGCSKETPAPAPGTGTTNPGSGTVTNPGSGTTTNPGSGTTTNPGSGTIAPGTVVASVDYIKQKSNLTFLAAAIAQAGLTAELNKAALTIFAPSDDAFKAAGYASVAAVSAAPAADLQRLLRYHVIGSLIDLSSIPTKVNTSYQTTLADARVSVYKVDKSNVSINGAKVTEGDIPTTGSTIHIINKVLTPPTQSAVDVSKANSDLSLFTAAVSRAGTTVQDLVTKNSENGVTIFAPNDAAFKAAGYADAAAIQAADPKVLADLLAYHILNYRAFAQTFQNGSEVVTAQGTSIKFNVSGDKVTITGKGNGTNVANILRSDLIANNGVIHVIDRVLLFK